MYSPDFWSSRYFSAPFGAPKAKFRLKKKSFSRLINLSLLRFMKVGIWEA